jgi:hypothetical protein
VYESTEGSNPSLSADVLFQQFSDESGLLKKNFKVDPTQGLFGANGPKGGSSLNQIEFVSVDP